MEECNLGELATLYDSLHKTPKSYSEDGFPMVRVTDINRGFVTLQNVKYVDEETYLDFSKKHQPQVGDIIYARVGNTYGKSCYVDKAQTFCLGQNLVCITADKNKVDPFFLYSFLNSDDALGQMRGLVAGGAQPTISLKSIKEIKLNFPSLNEQILISDALKNYDNLIENNNRRIAILEDMAQSLYREWFVNFRYPSHEDNLDTDGNPKLIDSPLGQIPEGWEIMPISACYKTSSGGTPSRKQVDYYGEDHWWVKTKELKDGFVVSVDECISELGLKKSSAKLFPKHSVVMAMYGATIGRLGILSEEASTNQACCALLPLNDNMSNWFIYLLLLNDRKKLISLGQGAAQQNISQTVIQGFKILVPSGDLLNRFNQIVEPMFLSIENLYKRNMNLKQQRNMLLPKLISGQIEL